MKSTKSGKCKHSWTTTAKQSLGFQCEQATTEYIDPGYSASHLLAIGSMCLLHLNLLFLFLSIKLSS